ncbi:MAG: succinylglutamate desuccinylase/aspartoacylase family protein [Algiphilus sp.]|uniref:succinylglutamate desuccinylase/aspartoacylase family protein n=1 Tax=Algiphilus sp. TaxID=1872431 RepID=UPI0025C0DD16|nr:succinylglutamate desuccinylase/aspartoacylase family protein [Algiphilus sp.]MCI5102623.1 succinylglutamate desuccinylase/aspartoacylase family protein [Algiphilus sp.]
MPTRFPRRAASRLRAPSVFAIALLAWAGGPLPAVGQAVETSDEYTAQPPRQDASSVDTGTATPIAPRTLDESLHEMAPAEQAPSPGVQSFSILDGSIPPGETLQVPWYASDSFTGLAEPTPVLVAHGTKPGPVLCVTAAVHGDELNGIEMVRRLLYEVDASELRGTLIGVPIVNLFGFRQGSRYLPDRRDLNRHFPGHPQGSAASRIAYSLFNHVIRRCSALVDLHTGSFHRTNLPQLRADLSDARIADLTRGFGATVVLNSEPPEGTLRQAATAAGVPTITVEAGEPMRFQPEEVKHGVRALRSLMSHMGMLDTNRLWSAPQPVYYESHWVRADDGGILTSEVGLGDTVREGEVLGSVTDPITNRRVHLTSPNDGRVIGMALNQAVIPGFAAYHIGVQRQSAATEEEPSAPAADATSSPEPNEPASPAVEAPTPAVGGDTETRPD